MNLQALSSVCYSFTLSSFPYIKSRGTFVGTQNMSQKVNSEWMNVKFSCKHVVHRVSIHPITWDACCSSLKAKVPMFDLPPLSVHRSMDGKQCSSSIWCPSSSISWSKTLQGSESPNLTQLMWVTKSGPKHTERKEKQSALQ